MPYVDIAVANEEHMRELFGIEPVPEHMGEDGELTDEGYVSLAERFSAKFGVPTVAMTLRRTLSADDNRIRGMVWMSGQSAFSRWYDLHMVDRFGGGDAFTAGLLYALSHGMTLEESVELATASSALKHSVESDYNDVTLNEVMSLMRSTRGAGRMKR